MLLLSLILTAAPNAWLREEALTSLDCVRAWEQLCAVDETHFPEFVVTEKRVTVRPYMDETELVFKVVKNKSGTRTLVATYDEKEVRVALVTRGAKLEWNGPDVLRLLGGEGSHPVSWTLVRHQKVSDAHAALVKKFVPGGQCKELAVYEPTTPLPACINTK